jgi:F-type H+-transporting ATPase subunit delta
MKAAKRYAKALFELAAGNLDAVQNDMSMLQQSFNDNKELGKVLKDPTIGASKKLNIVKAVFKANMTDLSFKLVELLGKKDRLQLLNNVAVAFNELYKKHKQIREVTVITAIPLDSNLEKAIFTKVKTLTGSNEIKLTNVVDSSIIGGFILNMDDLRYDASISGKLAKIKSKLVE